MKISNKNNQEGVKVKLWQMAVLLGVIFVAYVVVSAAADQDEMTGVNALANTNDLFLSTYNHKWEVGDWWVVRTTYNNSIISGIPEDEPNMVLLKYEVISKNVDQGKKNSTGKNEEPKIVQIGYVIRETYLSNPETYRDLYYRESKISKSLDKVETHYFKRGQNVTYEEYYEGDNELDVPVITPALANENSGQKKKKYEKQITSYGNEKKGKKHISGMDFDQVDKFDLYDDKIVKITQLVHHSAPWPIYEKTDYTESELLDYSGWHELSEEALAKIPDEHKNNAKTDAKKFQMGATKKDL